MPNPRNSAAALLMPKEESESWEGDADEGWSCADEVAARSRGLEEGEVEEGKREEEEGEGEREEGE